MIIIKKQNMKITNIKIENFRLLKNVEINIDKTTTAIVGKNNTGKTSFTKLFDIFINDKGFSFDDFSLNNHVVFEKIIENYQKITDENREEVVEDILKNIPKISLLVEIEYDKTDNWANIKPFHIGLTATDSIKILFEFASVNTEKFLETIIKEINELKKEGKTVNTIEICRQFILDYYKSTYKPYSETEFTDCVSLREVRNLLQCSFIYAQRAVEDSHSEKNSKLSSVFEHQYKNKYKEDRKDTRDLTDTVDETSEKINKKLKTFFDEFIVSFSEFGFPNVEKEELELKSDLKIEKLFKNDVKLYYKNGINSLPENYNGLGYSNLIYIISKIIGFQEEYKESEASLCLIFIEEPEAHMHPQMQSVFINKINTFLKKRKFNVQVILTTHSSHILTNANFESIRYFTLKDKSTLIKDLMKFNPDIDKEETLDFLKQYLTLGKADLFFADKAILFEGVVERLLMPLFIRKTDKKNNTVLTENYISYIEVGGAYANKFKELLAFLELKTLIITDIDSIEKITRKNVEVTDDDELLTSNVTIEKWIPSEINIKKLLLKTELEKVSGVIRVAYQMNVASTGIKCGRSFEEAFIIDNIQYIYDNNEKLISIKNHLKKYSDKDKIHANSYAIQEFIDRNKKKTDFAFDLLTINTNNWLTPNYIEEGLIWLAK